MDCTKLIDREGWDCSKCGHRHAGRTLANICIGCPCPETSPALSAPSTPGGNREATTHVAMVADAADRDRDDPIDVGGRSGGRSDGAPAEMVDGAPSTPASPEEELSDTDRADLAVWRAWKAEGTPASPPQEKE